MESALLGVRRKQQVLTHDLVDCELRAMDAIQQRMAGLLAGTSEGTSAVARSIAQLDQRTELAAIGTAAASVVASNAPSGSSAVVASDGQGNAGVPLASAWEELSVFASLPKGWTRWLVSLRNCDLLLRACVALLAKLRKRLMLQVRWLNSKAAMGASRIRQRHSLSAGCSATSGALHRDLLQDVQSIATLEHDLTAQLSGLRLVLPESLIPLLQRTLRESCRLSGHEAQLASSETGQDQ